VADGVGDDGDVLARPLGQAQEVGELGGQFPWGALRWGGDVDDRDEVFAGVLGPDFQLVGFAQELDGGGFPGRPRPGDDQAASGTDFALVQR
jgi:hypothetical protein